MAKGTPVAQSTRDEILARIKQGAKVSDLASEYEIGTKAIYNWIRMEMNGGSGDKGNVSLVLQLNKLKKENEQLYNLLGRITVELKRSKKS